LRIEKSKINSRNWKIAPPMPLLKSSNSPPAIRAFSLADIEAQARAVLQNAQREARRIVDQAENLAADLKVKALAEAREEGHKEGLDLGRQEGLRAGREAAVAEHSQAMRSAVAAFVQAMQALEESRRELEAQAVRDVLELALLLTEKITRRRAAVDRQVAVANVIEALRLVSGASIVRVALHPQDRAMVEEILPTLRMQLPRLQHIEIVDDPALTPGGCRVFTAGGEIDASIETQLQRVAADLLPAETEDRP
jgi:flagellar assembly protein FliH